MVERKPDNDEQTERRIRVYDLYLQGWTQAAIARSVDSNRNTVGGDIATMRTILRAESGVDILAAQEKELHRLDKLEREAWGGWERSKKPAAKVKTNTEKVIGKDGKERELPVKVERSSSNRDGSVAFLAEINSCVARRCKILGLDAPDKLDTTHTEFRVAGKTPEQVRAEIISTIAGLLPDDTNKEEVGK